MPWIECERIATAGISRAIAAAAAASVVRGSARRSSAVRIASSRARFAGDEMISKRISRPSAVAPITSVRTRSGAAAISRSRTRCC
ncbi:MAG: hypothetical protein R2909_13185 [Gemmatimonadales bacterium]